MGGAVAAVEQGWVQDQIEQAAFAHHRRVQSGEEVIVGVNKLHRGQRRADRAAHDRPRGGAAAGRPHPALRARRDAGAVEQALADGGRAAAGEDNLLPPMREALRAEATVGEVCEVLRGSWGTLRRPRRRRSVSAPRGDRGRRLLAYLDPMPDQRFAFMLGTGRCGSTIVGQVVAMHDQVGFIANVDDRFAGLNRKGRMNNRIYRSLPAPLQKQGGRRGGASGGRLAVRRAERRHDAVRGLPAARPARLADAVGAGARPGRRGRLGVAVAPAARRSSSAARRRRARPLFLHKFTGWPRAGLLHAVFPEARFVHVVRDGRAVASSLVQQPWWPGFGGPGGVELRPADPTRRGALA